MKTNKYMMMATAAIALALTACNNEDTENNGLVAARVTAGVNSHGTRALDTVWEGDVIGVMVTEAPTSNITALYKNVKYATTANSSGAASFTAETGMGIFFHNAAETVTFAAYAPYQTSAANALPGTDGVVSGSTESQNTRERQKAFDYLYTSGATASFTSPQVSFAGAHAFQHKMARLVIVVKTDPNAGFAATDVTTGTYSLTGLTHSGSFNVTTGEAKATAATTTSTAWSLTDNSLKTAGNDQVTFNSILYPQTLSNALTFQATIGGQNYKTDYSLSELQSGYSYTFTVTVKKTGLEISGATVSDWNTGTSTDGIANMY